MLTAYSTHLKRQIPSSRMFTDRSFAVDILPPSVAREPDVLIYPKDYKMPVGTIANSLQNTLGSDDDDDHQIRAGARLAGCGGGHDDGGGSGFGRGFGPRIPATVVVPPAVVNVVAEVPYAVPYGVPTAAVGVGAVGVGGYGYGGVGGYGYGYGGGIY
jgi:hypothetical protein